MKLSFAWVIDRGSEICGSQNKLALRIGSTSTNLAKAKSGRRPLPEDQLQALADVVGMDAHSVYMLHAEARSPFASSVAAVLATLFMMFVAATLSVAPTDAKASTGAGYGQFSTAQLSIH